MTVKKNRLTQRQIAAANVAEGLRNELGLSPNAFGLLCAGLIGELVLEGVIDVEVVGNKARILRGDGLAVMFSDDSPCTIFSD